VLVALMLTTLFGFVGLVVDIGWFQLNLVRVQRAADAGALAGTVYLPGNVPGAQTAALAATTQNGYTNGAGGVGITAVQDPTNNTMLNVTVTAPVRTWFMRLFGVNSLSATRNARAEFVLPVPMGSPQSYFGVHYLCRNSDTPPACPALPSATGVGTDPSQGFWASIEAKGTEHQNGDAYSTYNDSLIVGGPSPIFDPEGYSYIATFPAGTTNGKVFVFDPLFCATGAGTSTGRRLGAGDFWLTSSPHPAITTRFKLWDTNGTPYTTADDTLLYDSGSLFANIDAVDKSANYRGNGDYGQGNDGSESADCSVAPLNAYHNVWWQMPAAPLVGGQYRVQVYTSDGSLSQNADNNFSIEATGNVAGIQVFGQTRMCTFNAIAGTSVFYLAQIQAVHAGKILEIKVFDPGDITNTSIKVEMPTTTGYVDATFSWSATGCWGGCATSGSNVTVLQSSNSSTNFFNDQWVTIDIALPVNYAAPTPPGEPSPGWWKIKYITLGTGQDIATWQVNIRGNPVHLVTP
jgi:hypothetical protein